MTLRADQHKQLLALYLDGHSIESIASKFHSSVETIKDFLPRGELALAYENSIAARRETIDAKVLMDMAKANSEALDTDARRCKIALESVNGSIADIKDTLKALRASKKGIEAQLADNAEIKLSVLTMVDGTTEDYEDAESAYTNAMTRLKAVEAEQIKQNKLDAERAARIRKAEMLAEESITTAAIAAAKDLVAQSVATRLHREEG